MNNSVQLTSENIMSDGDDKIPFSGSATLVVPSDSTSDLGSDVVNPSCDEFEETIEYNPSNSAVSPERSPLLRHVILHTVSSQLEHLKDRASLGRPTAIAVSSYLAVGTSAGVVLIFDSKQVLKCCLADRRLTDYGAVSCLAFSATGDRVAAGHARGHIVLWDVVTARLLVTSCDFHLPDCPVLHIRFTAFLPIAVVSDASGSVFALSFSGSGSTTSSTCISRLLFSGARGEALYFDVLSLASVQHCLRRLPFTDSVVVIIVTVASVIISTFSPSSGSIHKLLRVDMTSSGPTSPPVSCWCPTLNQVNIPSVNNASSKHAEIAKRNDSFAFRLCVGRGSLLKYFLVSGSKAAGRLSASSFTDVNCSSLQLPSDIQWICWPKPDFQLILDVDERLHVLSTASGSANLPTRLHSIDVSAIGIVYASGAFFKATATGSSVSRAMAAVGEHACYSSLACSNGQFFLMGTTGIHVLTPRALVDRVNQLMECGDRLTAVNILLSAHRGPSSVRPNWLDDRLIEMLLDLVATPSSEITSNDVKAIEELTSICFEKLASKTDLFSAMASSISSSDVTRVFVEQVLHLVRNCASSDVTSLASASSNHGADELTARITFPPQVVQLVFESLSANRSRFDDLSLFLCYVDIISLDLDRAIRFSLRNALYMPYIRLYWEALADWRTPLVTLLDIVVVSQLKAGVTSTEVKRKGSLSIISHASSSVSASPSSPFSNSCNDTQAAITTLLDFIDCLLARLYYPSRRPCPSFSEKDRLEAFDLLCSRLPSSAVAAEFPLTSNSSSSGKDSSNYAYLKALLVASPDRLLTLLSAVLDSAAASAEAADSAWNSRRQLLVDIIFEILESLDDTTNHAPKSPTGTNSITFDGSLPIHDEKFANVRLACYTFAVQELSVSVGRPARLFGDGFSRLVRGLFSAYGDPRAEAALFVLFRNNLIETYCSDAELLAMAEQANFFDLAAAVCLRHGWRARMFVLTFLLPVVMLAMDLCRLRYYFSVPAWLPRVFDFITESLNGDSSDPSNTSGDLSALLEMCCNYGKQLVAADSVRAARLVSDYLWNDDKRRDYFLEQLRQSSPRLLYTMLVKIRRPLEPNLLAERVVLAAQIECEEFVSYYQRLANGDDQVDVTKDDADDDIDEDDEQVEGCIRAVPASLLSECLHSCSQRRFKSCLPLRAFEKSQMFEGSFVEALILAENGKGSEAILMALNIVKLWLNLTIGKSKSSWVIQKLDTAVRRLLRIGTKVQLVKSDANAVLPSHILAELFCSLESETSSPRFSSVVSALCMVFGPSAIIEAVLRAPDGNNSVGRSPPCLGAIRRLLSTVFSVSGSEINSNISLRGIYSDELDTAFRQFRTFASRGIRLNSKALRCCICKRHPDEEQVLIFCCDHIAHPTCCLLLTNTVGASSTNNLTKSSSVHSMSHAGSITQTGMRRQQTSAQTSDNLVFCPICVSSPGHKTA